MGSCRDLDPSISSAGDFEPGEFFFPPVLILRQMVLILDSYIIMRLQNVRGRTDLTV